MGANPNTPNPNATPPVVGLTGGIGSGKTTASDIFAKLGVTVVDTDVVARQVVEPGTVALAQIAEHFGQSTVIDQQGALNRRALRQIIFDHPQEKEWLESLLHPLIRQETLRQLADSPSAYTILVSALLFESGQHKWCQRVLLIDSPEEQQIDRTVTRDAASPEQITAIMNAQMSRQDRLSLADDIIVNDDSLEALTHAVEIQHQAYLELFNA
jgi:dephospho-CoA kinase